MITFCKNWSRSFPCFHMVVSVHEVAVTYHKSFPNPVFSIIQFQTYDICLFAVKKCIISVKARHCALISVQIWSAAMFSAIFPFLQLGTVRQNQPDCSINCITSEITWKFIKFLIETFICSIIICRGMD